MCRIRSESVESIACRRGSMQVRDLPGLHVTFSTPYFSPFKNGLNEFLWGCSQILKYVKKIKGGAGKMMGKWYVET